MTISSVGQLGLRLQAFLWIVSFGLLLLLSGCGFAYDERLVGNYYLVAVDVATEKMISYELPDGGLAPRIPRQVDSVGWNEQYIVARCNGSDKEYYFLCIGKDSPYSLVRDCVEGPMELSEFESAKKRLRLPDFSRRF